MMELIGYKMFSNSIYCIYIFFFFFLGGSFLLQYMGSLEMGVYGKFRDGTFSDMERLVMGCLVVGC